MSDNKNTEKNSSVWNKVLTIIGTILCIILLPMLIINVTLIIRSYTNPDKVPSIGSYLPLIVLTDSMYPVIQSGDLIICHTAQPDQIKEGDVIAFFDPAGNGSSIVTHRVIEVTSQDGAPAWRTQGDANNAPDAKTVPADKLVGVYSTRIAGAGKVAMFMQTTQGLIICVICPIVLLVGYDMLRRRAYDKAHKQDTDALLKELEELRAQNGKTEESEKEN